MIDRKREIFDVVHEYKKLKDRIDKAIEYIDKELYNVNVQENIMLRNELLKIKSKLQGVDKE